LELRDCRAECGLHPSQPGIASSCLLGVHSSDEVAAIRVFLEAPESSGIPDDLRDEVEVLDLREVISKHAKLLVCGDLLKVGLGEERLVLLVGRVRALDENDTVAFHDLFMDHRPVQAARLAPDCNAIAPDVIAV